MQETPNFHWAPDPQIDKEVDLVSRGRHIHISLLHLLNSILAT